MEKHSLQSGDLCCDCFHTDVCDRLPLLAERRNDELHTNRRSEQSQHSDDKCVAPCHCAQDVSTLNLRGAVKATDTDSRYTFYYTVCSFNTVLNLLNGNFLFAPDASADVWYNEGSSSSIAPVVSICCILIIMTQKSEVDTVDSLVSSTSH